MSRELNAQIHGNRTVSDRRTFLGKAGATVGVGIGAYIAGVPAALAASVSRVGNPPDNGGNIVTLEPTRTASLAELNIRTFSQVTRNGFVFRTPSGSVTLTLIATEDLLTGKADHLPISDCFSLQFRGSANRPLEQGSYSVRHAQIGTFDLFVVPSGQNGRFRYYEAIFNRIGAPEAAIP